MAGGEKQSVHVDAGGERSALRENELFVEEDDGENEEIGRIVEERGRNALDLASEVAIDPNVHVQHEEMAGSHRIDSDVAKQVHREVLREGVQR